jgi:hypothetical protein
VEGPSAPIPHWREYNTTSRRTSLVIDPPDGRLPPRTPKARTILPQRCGSLSAANRATRDEIRARRSLHRPRRRISGCDVPGGIQRQPADLQVWLCRHHLRADSRHAYHPD